MGKYDCRKNVTLWQIPIRLSIALLCWSFFTLPTIGQTNIKKETAILNAPDEAVRQPAFLGVNIGELSAKKAKKLGFEHHYGTYVTSVIPATAAHKFGILPLDYIIGMDEYRVGKDQRLTDILRRYSAGDKANVFLIRKQDQMTLPVVLGNRADRSEPIRRNKCQDPFLGVYRATTDNSEGVEVHIKKNTTAHLMGLKNDDVITHINGYRILDWKDLSIAINMTPIGDPIKIDFLRDNKPYHSMGNMQSYAIAHNCTNCLCNDEIAPDNELAEQRKTQSIAPPTGAIKVTELSSKEMQACGIPPAPTTVSVDNLVMDYNPTTQNLNLSFILKQKSPTVITIQNTKNRIVYEYDLGSFSGLFEDNVALSKVNGSFYILSIQQGQGKMVRKVVLD